MERETFEPRVEVVTSSSEMASGLHLTGERAGSGVVFSHSLLQIGRERLGLEMMLILALHHAWVEPGSW